MPAQRPPIEQLLLPHLGAAYNLARWLLRNDSDAADIVQESLLRALPSVERARDPRAWLLTIVRNTAYSFLQQHRARELGTELEEPGPDTPEVLLLRSAQQRVLNQAVEALPVEFREVFVLRELEGLSYREIAEVAGIPMGTVMSRLSRARRQLQAAVLRERGAGAS